MDRETPSQNTNALCSARRFRSARRGYPELVNGPRRNAASFRGQADVLGAAIARACARPQRVDVQRKGDTS